MSPQHPLNPADEVISDAHLDIMSWCWETINTRLDSDSIALALEDIMKSDTTL